MNRNHAVWALSLLMLTTGSSILHGESASGAREEVLEARLQQIAASFPGKAGVFVRDVETGSEAGIHADEEFPMASTYKVAIMTQVFRDVEAGRLSLTERVPLTENDVRPGSGLLSFMAPRLAPTIHDLILMMITVSDNEATDLLLRRVGAARVDATLHQLGIRDMRVDRPTLELIKDWLAVANPHFHDVSAIELVKNPALYENLNREQMEKADEALTADPRDHSSPRAMADLLTKIVKSEAASPAACADMLKIMQAQQLRTRIHRYLEGVTIASKNGTIGATTNDVGVLYAGNHHIVVSVYTLKGNSDVQTEQAEEFIGRVARAAYDYYQDKSAPR